MIEVAVAVARTSNSDNYKIGCVVVNSRGGIISTGVNSLTKTHPIQAMWARKGGEPARVFLHAEIHALIRCRETPYALYVARVTRGGKLGLSKPCPVCSLAIKEAGVKKVYYTDVDGSVSEYEVV
jgi:tRNA(Arg) A34 adenosine deaminase TadA